MANITLCFQSISDDLSIPWQAQDISVVTSPEPAAGSLEAVPEATTMFLTVHHTCSARLSPASHFACNHLSDEYHGKLRISLK
jgi:hypothetical protein